MVERARRRIGHRGWCLLAFGLAYVAIGLGNILEPPVRPPGVVVLHELINHTLYGSAWIVTGLVAACFCWADAAKGKDKIGFGFLFLVPVVTCLSFYVSWISLLTHHPGYSRGWVSGTVYLLVMTAVWNNAGWPEPARTLPTFVVPRGGHGRRRTTD